MTPAPVESCHAFIASHYSHLPVPDLLADCLRATIQLVHRRRHADLCPFLTPDAPPLMDRLLTTLLHSTEHCVPSHWLLDVLVDLLSPAGAPLTAVEDVLRAVPRLQAALLPAIAPLPSGLLRRLFPLVAPQPFLVAWLLQSAALCWEQSADAARASLVRLIRSNAAALRWSAHRQAVRVAVAELHPAFVQELERANGDKIAVDGELSPYMGAVQGEDELVRDGEEEVLAASLATLAGVKWVEVDWSRVCDDDLNLAQLHRVERDRKAVKRSAAPPLPTAQPLQPTLNPPSDGRHLPSSPLAACQREAQTQTESLATPPAFADDEDVTALESSDLVDLSALLLPSFDGPPPDPRLRCRLSSAHLPRASAL